MTACAAGCASARANSEPPRTVTVVVSGATTPAEAVGAALEQARDLPVRVRRAEVPHGAPPPESFGEVSASLARARHGYVEADFRACLGEVSDDARIVELLGAGRRDLASRALFWRAACRVGAGEEAEASRVARRFAVLGLDVPSDVDAVAPEVEAALGRAQREVAAAPRVEVRLTVPSGPASFSVDGRVAACGSPCVVDLPEGDHVVRLDAEGSMPVVSALRVEGQRVERALETSPAAPAVAAEQWSSRYAGTPLVDAGSSLRLLSQAVRARDLLLVTVDATNGAVRLRASYASEGVARASGERVVAPDAVSSASLGLLRELLSRGGTVVERPIYTSPWFWLAVGGAAVTASVVAGVVAAPQPVRTEVRW